MLDKNCKFSTVPLSLLQEDCNLTAINVYVALESFLKEGKANPTAREISERAGMSLPTILKRLSDLEELGYIGVERDKKYLPHKYIIKFGKGIKAVPFAPPTLEELDAYAQTLANKVEKDKDNDVLPKDFDIDLGYFINYYEARDWCFNGGQKMKSWKATFKMWIARARLTHTPKERFVVKNEP